MKTLIGWLVAWVLVWHCLPARAGEQIPDDVRAFSNAYYHALQTEGAVASLRFLHPDALHVMKEQLLADATERDPGWRARKAFGEKITLAQLRAMPDLEFLQQTLKGEPGSPDSGKMLRSAELIGIVREGDLVHLVVRTVAQLPNSRMTNVNVTTLKRFQSEWRALLTSTTEKAAVPPPGEAQ